MKYAYPCLFAVICISLSIFSCISADRHRDRIDEIINEYSGRLAVESERNQRLLAILSGIENSQRTIESALAESENRAGNANEALGRAIQHFVEYQSKVNSLLQDYQNLKREIEQDGKVVDNSGGADIDQIAGPRTRHNPEN